MKNSERKNDRKGRQVYAELLCDFMFKRIFGSEENKDVLMAFLNVMLDDAEITDVEFIPTEHFGATEQDSKAVFDISCRCRDGKTFIIEMQKGYQKHFRKRALYYTSYPINEQGRMAREAYIRKQVAAESCGHDVGKFRWDFDLKPVVVVSILNFKFDHVPDWPCDRYHSSYRLREDTTHEVMTDVLRFVFLELGRFSKHLWELESRYDKWMYAFKHIHEMVEIPDIMSEPEFRRLFILSEIATFTPEEIKSYEESMKDMSDYYNIIDTAAEEAEKRGIAIGLEKGMVKGREEGIAATIRLLASNGMSSADICKATGYDAPFVDSALAGMASNSRCSD